MEDAKGNKYDAKGNIIPPQNPGPNPSRVSDPTLERAGMMDIGEPENYETEVKPFIEAATTPMNYALESPAGYSGLPVSTGTVQTAEPTLLETMKIATQLAASGQPSDERGAANWSLGRQEAVRRLVGAPEGGATPAYRGPFGYNPSDTANYLNTLIDFSPYAFVEMSHDLPYEGARTGDYGTAATEGALNVALTAPVIAAIGAMGRAGYNALRRNPKVAAGLAGVGAYFMPEDAEAGPERWFSKLVRAAEALPMEKMTGEQALAMLRKTAPQEEIKWTGLEGFASENPVTTKKALLDFIKRNQVQTQDVVLGGSNKPTSLSEILPSQIPEAIKSKYREPLNQAMAEKVRYLTEMKKFVDADGNVSLDNYPQYMSLKRKSEVAGEALDRINISMRQEYADSIGGLGRGTKYQSYSTPGGQDYRETLITYEPNREEYAKSLIDPAVWSRMTPEQRAEFTSKPVSMFKSGHWDDPNIVGHIRTQMLTANPPGASRPLKLFNVDEAQSDWGKAGRERGFDDPVVNAEFDRLKGEIQELEAQLGAEMHRLRVAHNEKTLPFVEKRIAFENDLIAKFRAGEITRREMSMLSDDFETYLYEQMKPYTDQYKNEMETIIRPMENSIAQLRANADAVVRKKGTVKMAPYVTSTQNWTDLSIKKALDQAIDSGADYFTFTPGEVQAARYDLSKHIGKVQYNPDDGSLLAYDPKGRMVINESVSDPSDLDEYVGRELGDKIRAEASSREAAIDDAYELSRDEENDGWVVSLYGEPSYGRNGDPLVFGSRGEAKDYINELKANDYGNNPVSLSGLDLRTGGEGMIDYYSNIYKKRVEKVVKELTGKKVQWEVLPAETAEGIVPRLGFRIDDDLREAKFPTFASGGIVNKALELTRDY